MEILWGYAALAGIVGALLMVLAMLSGYLMGLRTDMLKILGLFVVSEERDRRLVHGAGLVLHLTMGVLFGILYALSLTALGVAHLPGLAALWGALLGVVHGLVVGAGLGVLPVVHPRMGEGPGATLAAPGFFGRNVGVAMPTTLVLLHIIYGVAAGVVYSAAFL